MPLSTKEKQKGDFYLILRQKQSLWCGLLVLVEGGGWDQGYGHTCNVGHCSFKSPPPPL